MNGIRSITAYVREHEDEFVEKVYVYQTERVAGYKVQRIRIVWNCIGEFEPPATKEQEKTA